MMTISGVRYTLWGVRCIQELPKVVPEATQQAPTIEVVAAAPAPDMRVSWSSSAVSPCVPITTLGNDCSPAQSRTVLPPLRPGQGALLTIEVRVRRDSGQGTMPNHMTVTADCASRATSGTLVTVDGPSAHAAAQDLPFVDGRACCKIRVLCVATSFNFKVRLKLVSGESGKHSRSCVLYFTTSVEFGLQAEGVQRSYLTGGVDGGLVRKLSLPVDVRTILSSHPKDVIQNAEMVTMTPVANRSQSDGAELHNCGVPGEQMWVPPNERCNWAVRCASGSKPPQRLRWKSAGIAGTVLVAHSAEPVTANVSPSPRVRFHFDVETAAILACVRVSRVHVEISCMGDGFRGTLFVAFGLEMPEFMVLGGCTRKIRVSPKAERHTFLIGKQSQSEQRLFLGFAPELRDVVFWHHAPVLC
mmetsp:Transcript_23817/g.54143  ORF Transcript_23817/g.54143 Transcript_23817/m.54143 type:complete len:415 (+) Transcript_23817:1902-3146(+)